MLQNLKIDIIYYETPSDFEFEFNLGGCCHCRVLNNTTSSPKEMIGCLSKAVGRSRVIIVIGDLNKPNGLYLLISKAIGRKLIDVSADEYNLSPESDTTTIEGALPLVSSDGLLSGCVIESGPQSIILLSEEKSLRKDVAENLVFQYISAVSRTPDTDSVIISDSATQQEETQSEIIEEQIAEDSVPSEEITEDISENTEQDEIIPEDETPAEVENIEETEEITEQPNHDEIKEVIIPEEDSDFFDIFAEESENTDSNNFVYSKEETSEYDEIEDTENRVTKNDKSLNLIIWLIIGLMFIIIGILAYMLIYTPLKNGVNITEYVKQIFNQ